MKHREIRIPTLLGLFVAVVGLVSGLWLISGQLRQRILASAGDEPQNIKISNIFDTSFVVSWTTTNQVSGFIQYGEMTGEPDLVVSDERDQQKGAIGNYMTHYVVVRGLKPETKYHFRVGSGRNVYDKNGQLYEIATGPTLSPTPAADVAYGQIVTQAGEPADGALVYITIPGMSELVGMVKSSGSWVVPLSTGRSMDLGSFGSYNSTSGFMTMVIRPVGQDTMTLSLPLSAHSPVPQITLGQQISTSGESTTPSTASASGISKLSSSAQEPEVSEAGQLILLAPKFGENINSNRPQIIGNAPAGTEVKIEVHSTELVSGTVVANSSGNFSFNVPQDLSPGEHTVTITALIDGAMKTITRSFTVYAAGESNVPYYSATPSATLSPSPTQMLVTPSPTPRVSTTPRASITPQASPTAKVTPTVSTTPKPTTVPRTVPATDSALPRSGYDLPTFMLIGLGAIFVISGLWWYKRVV